ncbi:hypothetical protein TRFO_21546 [Tritrichomonas foetus]|uniref:Adenylate and Guanylate cyclase catalytic domain containing protein n=1 Tax=Tritrichomonas foetus TaxID=1144522 RepID=A0A1J4KDR4_9EUKA|nr:hypothetical protein TRFO_21546 [Tritrichomonas foetus]|eukprot:OHT09575.1 hypothetical protein TRFO_21546 [Tritrichomonas foetus]
MSVIHPQSLAAQLSSTQTTRMTTVVGKEEEVLVAEWCESFLFPFLAEVAAKTSPHVIVTFFQLIITLFQIFSSYLYLSSDILWGTDRPKWIKSFSYLTNLGVINDPDFKTVYPQYIVFYAYFILEALLFMMIYLWYQSTRSFFHWQLELIRFFLSANLVFVPIGASLTGYAVVETANKLTISAIFVLAPTLILTVILSVILYYGNWLLSYNPYLPRSITASWSSVSQNALYMHLTLTAFLGPVLNIFPTWLFIFTLVSGVIFCIYEMYHCSFLPFVKKVMNVIFFGLIIESFIATLMSFVKYFYNISVIVITIDVVIVIILSMIIFNFGYISQQESKITELLSPGQERMSPDEINQYFDKVTFSSYRSAQMFLHVGVSKLCPSLTNFSFMRYMVDNYMQTDILFSILQITAFFPCEQQFLSYLLTVVRQIPTIHFGQNFMIYQIQKIRIIRQSSVSLEVSSALEILKKMSLDTISQVRGFWTEILHSKSDISISSLYYLGNITVRTNAAFMDAIDRFPNSQGLNDAYCTFLIEAKGDFSKAVHISHRLSMIEQGKQFVTDLAFLNFINVFPEYLKQKVLTVHGNRAMTDMSSMESSSTDRSFDWSSDSIDMDLLNKKCEDIIVGMIDHGKLRLSLQHAMRFFTPTPLKIMMVLVVLQFVSYFIIAIVILTIVPSISEKPLVMMRSFTHTNNYMTSYLYMADICCGFQVQEVSDMLLRGDCLDHISKTLNISLKKLKSSPSIFNEPAISLHQSIIDFQDEFTAENQLAIQNMDLHTDLMAFLTNDSMDTMIQLDPLSSIKTALIEMPLKSRIISQASLLDYISSYLEMNNYDSQYILSMGSIMRDIYTSGPLINQVFDLLSPPSLEVCDQNEKSLRELTIIAMSVLGSFFAITEMVTYFFIVKMNKKLSNILRSVKPEVVRDSGKPISKKGNKKDLSTGSRHSPHDFSFIMATLPIIFLLSLIIVTALICLACINYAESINFIKQLFVCSYHASLRAANIQSIFLNIALNKTGLAGDTFEVDEQTIELYLEQILNTTSTLNLELIGQNEFFDQYYFSDHSNLTKDPDFTDFIDSVSMSNRLNLAYMYLQIVFILHKIRIEDKVTSDTEFLFGNEFINFLFILDMYVADLLKELQQMLFDFTEKRFHTMYDFVLLMSILTLVALFFILLIEGFILRRLLMSYDAFKQLILLIDPVSTMKNKTLLELITGISVDDSMTVLKPSELILTSMESCIVTIDKNLIIQNVNDSVQILTGFTPDQVLGQGVTFLVPVPMDDQNKIDMSAENSFYPVIHDILAGIGDPSITVDVEIMTENTSLMKTQMTIIPQYIKNEVESIALIFTGVQQKLIQVQKLKILQQRVDTLLQSYIPKVLFNDPNFGDKSTIYRAEQATIVYIEICGLSDFVFTMSPKQLISATETVYTAINNIALKYDTVEPIKENDDQYIAVLGLFDRSITVEKQVNDAICFADEVLSELENINEQLDADIPLGIGVHTGGPVVGYIEDPVKLRIEVLSETLRASIKMQELGERNVIQLTESVAQLMVNPKFDKIPVHKVKTNDREEQVYYLREISCVDQQKTPSE